jgi:hypothetical protein
MKKLVKIVVFIGILTLFAANNLNSQNVRFRLKHNIAKTDIKLDSVRAIQKNGSMSFTIKTIYFDFDTLIKNEIRADNPHSNEQLSYITENILTLPLVLKTQEEISVDIYNILGSKAGSGKVKGYEGNNNLKIDISGFDKGLYFVNIISGYENKMYKVMKENPGNGINNQFSIYNENNFLPMPVIDLNRLLADYKFDFIAYSKGYIPDTLTNVVLKNDTTLMFYLEEGDPFSDPYKDTTLTFIKNEITGKFGGEFLVVNICNGKNVYSKSETTYGILKNSLKYSFKPKGNVHVGDHYSYDNYLTLSFNNEKRVCTSIKYSELYFDGAATLKKISFTAYNIPYLINNNRELIISISGEKIVIASYFTSVLDYLSQEVKYVIESNLVKFNPEMSSIKITCKSK